MLGATLSVRSGITEEVDQVARQPTCSSGQFGFFFRECLLASFVILLVVIFLL